MLDDRGSMACTIIMHTNPGFESIGMNDTSAIYRRRS